MSTATLDDLQNTYKEFLDMLQAKVLDMMVKRRRNFRQGKSRNWRIFSVESDKYASTAIGLPRHRRFCGETIVHHHSDGARATECPFDYSIKINTRRDRQGHISTERGMEYQQGF
jgi:hypothetical protein